jgi:16S rRNA (guanine(966)-N(2))-methyltransferase RsmD
MRIVGGSLKGRRFSPPKNFRARPTTDTARESLFNILTNHFDFEELTVLDLFSGTGAISFEFASRGVPKITCVEKDYHHYSFIQRCINELDLGSVVQALKADVFTFITKGVIKPVKLIFADPPFDLPHFDKVLPAVLESGLLAPEGLFILEHGPQNNYASHPAFQQLRKYGKVHFSFFGEPLG